MKTFSEFAFQIVNHFLKLSENNVISISAEIRNSENSIDPLSEIDLAEELALEIRKKRAFPFLDISTENLKRRFFNEMPESVFSQTPEYYLKWIDSINTFIEISWKNIAENFYSESFQNKLQMQKSTHLIWQKIVEQNKNIVFLNFPSRELAEFLNIDYEHLKQVYLKAATCNYNRLRIDGLNLKEQYLHHQDFVIRSHKDELYIRTDSQHPELFSDNSENHQIYVLPTGFLGIQLNRKKINGFYFAEQLYYDRKIHHHVKIHFDAGYVRFISFPEENENTEICRNAILNSKEECFLMIGFNPELTERTGFLLYDRCLQGNISISLTDANQKKIVLSNCKVKIEKM